MLTVNIPAADLRLQEDYFLSLVSSLMSHKSSCWSSVMLLIHGRRFIIRLFHLNVSGTHFSDHLNPTSVDGWEMKASVMVDAAESRSITLSSVPPHTPTLAQLRASGSKQQRTDASDLYVVNNRMMVTFSCSGLSYWPFGGHSFQPSPWRSGDQYRLQSGNLCPIYSETGHSTQSKVT